MGIFKKNDAGELPAESGRMRPEDLVTPKPAKPEDAASGTDPAEPGQGEATQEPTGDSRGNPDQPKNKGPAKVIAFANQKGGVAKTTTALNLAVAFKESGHRVLAVDMDPQGNLTMS